MPVIRDVDKKGLLEIAEELIKLSGKAREGKLSGPEMSGATFTISSLGGIGGTGFTPIVNAPRGRDPRRDPLGDQACLGRRGLPPRLMVPLSLSYDHRVVDGAAAARFCVSLVKVSRTSADRAVSEVRVPDIGDFSDVPVIEVLVSVGDEVEAEQGAGHARVRQGDDGRAGSGGRGGREDPG